MEFLKDFWDIVIEPTIEDFKDTKQSIKNDNQELKNEFKKMCKEVSPPIGEAVEQIDRLSQTMKNHTEAYSPIKEYIRKKVKSQDEIKKADHLFVEGKLLNDFYTHHGLYLGNGMVIHYSDFVVSIVSFDDFSEGRQVYILDSPILYSRDIVIGRAKSRLGERGYNLFNNNCEHFVRWSRSSDEW